MQHPSTEFCQRRRSALGPPRAPAAPPPADIRARAVPRPAPPAPLHSAPAANPWARLIPHTSARHPAIQQLCPATQGPLRARACRLPRGAPTVHIKVWQPRSRTSLLSLSQGQCSNPEGGLGWQGARLLAAQRAPECSEAQPANVAVGHALVAVHAEPAHTLLLEHSQHKAASASVRPCGARLHARNSRRISSHRTPRFDECDQIPHHDVRGEGRRSAHKHVPPLGARRLAQQARLPHVSGPAQELRGLQGLVI